MAAEVAPLIVSETTVLEKFDGDPAAGQLRERITIVDGEVVAHEYYSVDLEEPSWD